MRGLLILSAFLIIWVHSSLGQKTHVTRLLRSENFERAISYGESRIKELEEDGDESRRILKYYHSTAKVYYLQDDFIKAEELLERGLKLVYERKSRGKWLTIDDYNIIDELSLLELQNGNYVRAKFLIDQSLEYRSNRVDKKNPTNFRPYYALGLYHYRNNNPDSARYYIKTYQKNIRNSNHTGSLEINRYADNFDLLATIELEQGRIFQAFHFAKKNRRLQNHLWTHIESGKNTRKRILANEKIAFLSAHLGNIKKARKRNRIALRKTKRKFPKDPLLHYKTNLNYAIINFAEGQIDSCLGNLSQASILIWQHLDNGLSTLSEYEKENFLQQLERDLALINSITTTLLLQKKTDSNNPEVKEVLNLMINTRSVILNETSRIVRMLHKTQSDSISPLFNNWKHIKNQINYYSTRNKSEDRDKIDELQLELNRLEKELARSSIIDNAEKLLQVDSIPKYLDSGAIAIQVVRSRKFSSQKYLDKPWWYFRKMKNNYHMSDTVLYTFIIIDKKDSTISTLTLENGIELETTAYRNYFNSIKYKVQDDKSYERYLSPLKKIIKNRTHIYLSPDGIYNLVNLNALSDSSGKYAIDQYKIINLTSLKDLVSGSHDLDSISSALLVGNPDFNGYKIPFPQLPGAENEVKMLSEILDSNGVQTKVLLHEEAKKSTLMEAGNFQVLHIATHGYFDNEQYRNPMLNSGLVFSKATRDKNETSGFMTAYEMATLSLDKTNMAILSACETGLGKIKGGEGIYGLQRSLQIAGVEFIVMSFWKIDDAATEKLMLLFYRNLLRSKEPVESFIRAQLELRKTYPEPYYWSSFKLIGY